MALRKANSNIKYIVEGKCTLVSSPVESVDKTVEEDSCYVYATYGCCKIGGDDNTDVLLNIGNDAETTICVRAELIVAALKELGII